MFILGGISSRYKRHTSVTFFPASLSLEFFLARLSRCIGSGLVMVIGMCGLVGLIQSTNLIHDILVLVYYSPTSPTSEMVTGPISHLNLENGYI